ncbi:MAG TPA: amino-acid N-acetyltransferase [Pseudomonadales bacterium]
MNVDTSNSKTTFIQAFRQSSPYINAHRGKTFVIMLDGQALLSSQLPDIVHDIALLNSLGVRIVLVYGIRPQIEAALADITLPSDIHLGKRITSAAALDVIKQVSGKCRFELEALFSNGLPNSPMHGANIRTVSGNFITAKPLGIHEGRDYHFTGGVRKVDEAAINGQLNSGNIVLLSNIGYSSTGECFNLAAEEIAVQAAIAIRASKLIVYTDGEALQDLPRELVPEQARQLVDDDRHSLLPCLLDACAAGVERCHMIPFAQDGSLLLELFTTDGTGVLLSQNRFESIRPASINDVGAIMELLLPLEQKGILVKRERELLEQEIDHFIVVERDGMVIACSALYPFDGESAEIACVVTHPAYRGNNRGVQMLHYLEKRARQEKLQRVFVLTTQTAHFFLEQGFAETSLESLPEKKKQLYNYQRNSKIFSKRL